MSLRIPNLPKLILQDPKLGEALKSIQSYTNTNVKQVAGNKRTLSGLTNPTRPPV